MYFFMKLTEPNLKIKVNRSNIITLHKYLYELLTNTEEYFNEVAPDRIFKKIIIHNIKTVYEKVCRLIFKHSYTTNDFKENLILTDSEKLSLYKTASYYALPMDINFIEYELTNKLLKNGN